MKLQIINISDIKIDDDTFSLTPTPVATPSTKMVQSISRAGILHPPIIVEIADGIYRIGSGKQRILAARQLNIKTCHCTVFTATTNPIDIFNYIYEEASHTELPTISKAIFLHKANEYLNVEELASRFMEGFNLKANSFHVKKLIQLANLEINIQTALLEKRIDEKVCHELVKLDFIDRMGLFDIISTLSLSTSNQRKLLITSREIATRKQITTATFLGRTTLTTILTNESLNTPQKTAQFMAKLQELRFPLLSEAEHEFSLFSQKLPLTKEMTLSHSKAFEKDEISLTITYNSREKIEHAVTLLKPLNK